MSLNYQYILIVTIFAALLFSACAGSKSAAKDCLGEEGRAISSLGSLFNQQLFRVANYNPPGSYGILDWRDNHSKDNSYFTTRVDYSNVGDTIFCRKIDLAAIMGKMLMRVKLNTKLEENEAILKNMPIKRQKEFLRFGWIDKCLGKDTIGFLRETHEMFGWIEKHGYRDSDTINFLNGEQQIIENANFHVKELLKLGTVSYYYRRDTLEYIEGTIKQKGKSIAKYVQFLLGKDYLYIFQHDSFVVPPASKYKLSILNAEPLFPIIRDGYVISGSEGLFKPGYGVGNKYLFKNQKVVAILTKNNKEIYFLTKKHIKKGKELIEYYYKPLILLTNINL